MKIANIFLQIKFVFLFPDEMNVLVVLTPQNAVWFVKMEPKGMLSFWNDFRNHNN